MFSQRYISVRGARDEAEKPFWISYADLMTSLMMLFLVVMITTLAVLTIVLQQERQTADKYDRVQEQLRKLESENQAFINRIRNQTRAKFPNITVDSEGRVNLGTAATFGDGKSQLANPGEVGRYLAWLTRQVTSDLGAVVVDRVTIEGGASVKGDYLYNLDLSMERGMRVLCAGLAAPRTPQRDMRRFFLVGGSSFAATSKTRRNAQGRNAVLQIELRAYTVNDDGDVVREPRRPVGGGARQPTGTTCRTEY